MIEFDFDPEKNRLNKLKHGLDFDDAKILWKKTNVIVRTAIVNGEIRSAIVGVIHEEHYVCIFTLRKSVVRLISFHKADRRWIRAYEENTEK